MRFTYRHNYQRAKCEDLKIICEWFALMHNTKAKYGILKPRYSNTLGISDAIEPPKGHLADRLY